MGHRNKKEISENRKTIKKEIQSIDKRIRIINKAKYVYLNPKDKKICDSLNSTIKENKKIFRDIVIPYKDYLIKVLEINKKFKENSLIELVCEEKGHISTGGSIVNGKYVSDYCKKCDSYYQRLLSQKERNSWNKIINAPMTI